MYLTSIAGGRTVLQTVPPYLEETVAGIVAYLPAIVGAILVLLVGWIIGRVLGGVVTRIVRDIGLSKHTRGTPLESGGDTAQAVGKLVKFYVYFLAFLAAANILGIQVLSQLLSDIGIYLPVVLGAVVILVIGFIIGRVAGRIIADIVGGFGLGGYVRGTPLAEPAANAGGFGRIVGKVVEYYVYLLTLLAAAEALQIPALSALLATFAGYIPALVGGLIILVIGILVAEFAEDIVAGVDTSRLTSMAGVAVKLFVYYITITIALDTIGFDTTVLTTLFTGVVAAFLGAFALALAIGIGLGVGLGSKDYVAENIDDWANRAQRRAERMDEGNSGRYDNDDTIGSSDD
ncbi:mechanosensitive ion channel family protein [Halomarina rubra]|uniref:Phosphatase n=1 Tax=Halomarina rubra TaxID=2071873 RepID=A0ABD6AXD4_9EURY|nr:phosphatase [Halomarina rubra]